MSSAFANILAAMNKAKEFGGGNSGDNDRFWRCETDKAGNGSAIIRFLPNKIEDSIPFVKTFNHGFKNPTTGKWFIENCPTTIGNDCPVCSSNGPLWNSGRESDKDIVRLRKRKVSFVSNILVVADSAHPENVGRVFLFKYGKKIFDHCSDAMQPQFEDETPINPYDMDEGANFKLKIRKVEGHANYDKSEFEKPSKVENQDEVVAALTDISEFIDPKQYKSYDDLEKKFNTVWNGTGQPKSTPNEKEKEPEEKFETPKPKEQSQSQVKEGEEEDDDLAYFRSLSEED